ncbi:MFS transporter [Azorhizobium oxalatiphilum]|uniref:MFS transporter n=1 Tax=Azorhizobium oxalatiphilum TaxID=980631 RepID=A0A917BM80_9HYPH|nr:MFS transporter [Azorhizobium oxalatiphilum]GGF51578.1 MFS transporter [Azorhizobium oxalatiphilum]
MTELAGTKRSFWSACAILPPQPVFAVAAVLFGSFLVGFDTRLFSIALPDLRGAFGLSFDQGAWLSTIATAPQILVAPAVAWLAATFGVRRVLFWPSLVYAFISLAIPHVSDFPALLALHAVRGLLLGVFIPATIMIILRNLPISWWVPALAIYALRLALSQSAGVALVGFYEAHFGWQWVYWQDIFLAPLIGLLVTLGTPRDSTDRDMLARADWGGMVLFGTAWALIYTGLDQGNRLDWAQSGLIVSLLGTGVVLLACFSLNEMLVRHPWASHRVIASRNLLLAFCVILCFTVASLSNSYLVPNFLVAVIGLRPEETGWPILLGTVGPQILVVPLAVLMIRRFDARLTMLIGFAAFAIAGRMGTHLTHEWSPWSFMPVLLVQAVGQGFTFLATVVYILSNADPKQATAMAAYVQVLRLGGAEIGLSLMSTWLRHREQLHSYLLGLHVSAHSGTVMQALSGFAAHYAGHSDSTGLATARGMAGLAATVAREANVLAYVDGFQISFWAAIAGMLVVAFLGKAPQGPISPRY